MILTGIGIIQSRPSAPSFTCVVQCFTANGTWSCCTGTVCIEVVAIGAGGGGRNAVNPNIFPPMGNPGVALGGPGGGAGGVSICTLTSGFGTSQSVVIGTSSANANGGASCFGTLVRAGGGFVGAAAFACTGTTPRSAAGGAGGTGNAGTSPAGGCTQGQAQGNGDPAPSISTNLTGQSGFASAGFPGGGGGGGSTGLCAFGYQGAGGAGGAGSTLCGITLGAGGTGSTNSTGTVGSSFGGGGGGAGIDTNSGTFGSGVAGAPGIIKVTQFIPA